MRACYVRFDSFYLYRGQSCSRFDVLAATTATCLSLARTKLSRGGGGEAGGGIINGVIKDAARTRILGRVINRSKLDRVARQA